MVGGLKAVGTEVGDNVYIAILDEFGGPTETYMWNDYMYDEACWVNPDDYSLLETKPLVPGQSLWVQGASADQNIQSSGEVGAEDAIVKLQAGFTIAGNPFPVTIPVQDIVAEGDNVGDNVFMAILDEFGGPLETYMWNDYMFDSPCWVNPDDYSLIDATVPAGKGLWIQAESDLQYVRFPAPEL